MLTRPRGLPRSDDKNVEPCGRRPARGMATTPREFGDAKHVSVGPTTIRMPGGAAHRSLSEALQMKWRKLFNRERPLAP
jgi:hypothetical protein